MSINHFMIQQVIQGFPAQLPLFFETLILDGEQVKNATILAMNVKLRKHIIGYYEDSSYKNLFAEYLKTVTKRSITPTCASRSRGQPTSAGGTGKTTNQMKMKSTFTSMVWNFGIIWEICDGMNYPVLQWQILTCDYLCPDGVDFIDFSFFAQHLLRKNCNKIDFCGGTDLDQSGSVDFSDLAIFVESRLEGTQY
jgi:hypothetical protein